MRLAARLEYASNLNYFRHNRVLLVVRGVNKLPLIAVAALVCLAPTAASAGLVISPTATVTTSKSTYTLGETVTFTTRVENSQNHACTGTVTVSAVPATTSQTCIATLSTVSGPSTYAEASCDLAASNIGAGSHTMVSKYNGDAACLVATSTGKTVAISAPTPVPTTSEWTLWGMMAALLIGGGALLSRRLRAAA